MTKHPLSFYFISLLSTIISKSLAACALPLPLFILERNFHQGQEDVFSLATRLMSKVINSMILTLMLLLSQGMLFFMSLFFLLFLLLMVPFLLIPYLCHVLPLFKPNISAFTPPSFTQVHHNIDNDFLDEVREAPLIPLQILFPLEGLLDLLKDLHIYKSSTTIMLLLSSLCLLPNQVLLTLFLLMSHITIFLTHIRPSVVPFPPLLNLNFTIKLSLIPNGKLPWLLR